MGEGGGVAEERFTWQGSATRSKPLPFYILFVTVENLHYVFGGSVLDILKGPFECLNDSFSYPFLYLSCEPTRECRSK